MGQHIKGNKMTVERIKEIQLTTGYPDSVSVRQALLQVWNEVAQAYREKQIEKEKIKPLRGSAFLCEKNGWKAGDKLVGDEGFGDTVILLTAIGEEHILARQISHKGLPSNYDEGHWTLSCRKWRKVL